MSFRQNSRKFDSKLFAKALWISLVYDLAIQNPRIAGMNVDRRWWGKVGVHALERRLKGNDISRHQHNHKQWHILEHRYDSDILNTFVNLPTCLFILFMFHDRIRPSRELLTRELYMSKSPCQHQNTSTRMKSSGEQSNGRGLGEIRVPTKLSMTSNEI